MEQLTQAQHRAAEALYKNAGASAAGSRGSEGSEGSEGSAGAGGSGSGGSGGSQAQGEVIDAEVVDEEKK
jgi:hypothetical protein